MNLNQNFRILLLVAFAWTPIQADTFTGFTMDFVDIGNAGNAADATGYGAVDYNYRMGVNEVSRGMIDAYNTNSGGPTLTLQNMTSYGGNGSNRPATGVSWNEAARFVNWLNTSTGHVAAYQFDTTGANDNIALWEVGDAGYDASNPFRNSNAHYFLTSDDEWYKAAYYDGSTGIYYGYATGSDTAPTATSGGTADGTAVYRDGVVPNPSGPADITNAGGLSPYGTMAQNGNVWEWSESAYTAPNDSAVEQRVFRGGVWDYSSDLQPTDRRNSVPTTEYFTIGFRVAAVPEPSNTFSNWIDGYEVESLTGFGDDGDGDNLDNGLEAWFGTHPGEFNAGLSGLTTDGTTTTFSHAQNDDPPSDLTGYYEWSPNLIDWYGSGSGPDGGATVAFDPNTVGTTTTVTATASEVLDEVFLRVVVMQD